MTRTKDLTPWNPSMVYYNSETRDLYEPTPEYDFMVSDMSNKGVQYRTKLCDIIPDLKPQRDLVSQIRKMMRDSLPKQPKGLPNGKDL